MQHLNPIAYVIFTLLALAVAGLIWNELSGKRDGGTREPSKSGPAEH